ncbi:MAG: DUF1995 family protein [Microcoleaceae cyanobacterium]
MTQLPTSIDQAVEQAKLATTAAINDGYKLLQVELVFPEIGLQAQSIAQQFIPVLEAEGTQLKVLFPDAGSAALAKRDWGETSYNVTDIGTTRSTVENRIDPEDQLFLVVSPSPVEVAQVEQLSHIAGDRPVILLNPRLEDVAIIGIGYAARQLRERFISKIESCYYLQPLDGAALIRCYPSVWEVWLETDGNYQCIAQEPIKPVGDTLDQILIQATPTTETSASSPQKRPRQKGLLAGLQNFLNALSR